MISSNRIPPIAVLSIFYCGSFRSTSIEKDEKQKTKAAKKRQKGGYAVKKSDITHTNSFTFFFLKLNLSFLVSHEAHIILHQTTKFHIQERAYQCICGRVKVTKYN